LEYDNRNVEWHQNCVELDVRVEEGIEAVLRCAAISVEEPLVLRFIAASSHAAMSLGIFIIIFP